MLSSFVVVSELFEVVSIAVVWFVLSKAFESVVLPRIIKSGVIISEMNIKMIETT